MTFRQVHDFMLAYCAAEHNAYRAMLLFKNYPLFESYKQVLDRFGPSIGFSSRISRWEGEPLPSVDEATQELCRQNSLRLLLRIEKYTMPDRSTIYAACMTDTLTMSKTGLPELSMNIRYLLKQGPTGLQIISRQYPPSFAFPNWETTGGRDIQLPEQPDEVVVYIEEE